MAVVVNERQVHNDGQRGGKLKALVRRFPLVCRFVHQESGCGRTAAHELQRRQDTDREVVRAFASLHAKPYEQHRRDHCQRCREPPQMSDLQC